MKSKEILVIGAGIAGCVLALSLAKKGISVTIVGSVNDQQSYHDAFISWDHFEERVKGLQLESRQLSCSRALEQISLYAKKNICDLLDKELTEGKKYSELHQELLTQLRQMEQVEWLNHHHVIELLTLQKHSTRQSDIFKVPSCLGAYIYNEQTGQVETVVAKETIVATACPSSIYPYSTQRSSEGENGIALAHQVGARLLNLDLIQFYPLAVYIKNGSCVPLPLELLREGAKLLINETTIETLPSDETLAEYLYTELVNHQLQHAWLDVADVDLAKVQKYFSNKDFKNRIPVVPVAHLMGGGISVDRVGQTTVQRLRAVGKIACTGFTYDFQDEGMSVLEELAWGIACAEDVAKQVSRFIYYFPEVREWNETLHPSSILKEDWKLLASIMWSYAGIVHDESRLKKGVSLLQNMRENLIQEKNSIDKIRFKQALDIALLMTDARLNTP